MKLKYALLIITMISSMQVTAQAGLDDFNKTRIRISKNGLIVLGGFAAGNLVTSVIARSNTTGEAKYFHRMNTMISAVNVGLTGISVLALQRKNIKSLLLPATFKEQAKGENLFLFNTGLDIAYVVGGFLIKQKSKTNLNPDKYNGYGNAIIYQGGALFLFDGILFLLHKNHGKELIKMIGDVDIKVSQGSVGLKIPL